jgi:predicted phosphate transport protein (TIGR00153 family)
MVTDGRHLGGNKMFGLIPKDDKFFAMFREMSYNIIEGAELLKDMLDNFTDPAVSQRRIKEIEHKGDTITHEIIKKLNKSFITPFDREDIYALSSALDDILDLIDASAQRVVMYNVEKPTPESKELAFLILKSCQVIDKIVAVLGGKLEPISAYCIEVNALENEADRVCREAISRLFDEEKDPIQLIKWKEIYETLETTTDKCEDAANILESVVVKNA